MTPSAGPAPAGDGWTAAPRPIVIRLWGFPPDDQRGSRRAELPARPRGDPFAATLHGEAQPPPGEAHLENGQPMMSAGTGSTSRSRRLSTIIAGALLAVACSAPPDPPDPAPPQRDQTAAACDVDDTTMTDVMM